MIPATGFCIHLKRQRQEKRKGEPNSRTIGTYRCYWNAEEIPDLTGQIVERGGPGDNTTAIGNEFDRRIKAGLYPLAIQNGTKYKTIGYADSEDPKAIPRPGILVAQTEERVAILLHPAQNYFWSVGCLNPASGLTNADSQINYKDSRMRIIAIIEAIKERIAPKSKKGGTPLPKVVLLIEGEPT